MPTLQERTDKFIEQATVKHEGKFDYSLLEYKNNHTNVTIICPIHGEFQQQPINHLNSKEGCYQCGKDRSGKNHRLTQEKFTTRANKIHNGFYSYDKTKYVGSFLPVIITCPVHGDFKIQPNDHLFHKSGCKKCGYENRLTKGEQAIANLLEENGVHFVCQHTFADLKALDGINHLRFDFFVPSLNLLIEFDGPHHDGPIRYRGTSKQKAKRTYERTVIYDQQKNKYATKKGIRLLRIPYNEKNNIENILEPIIQ